MIVKGLKVVMSSVSISRTMSITVFYKGSRAILNSSILVGEEQLKDLFVQIEISDVCPGTSDEHLINAISKNRI